MLLVQTVRLQRNLLSLHYFTSCRSETSGNILLKDNKIKNKYPEILIRIWKILISLLDKVVTFLTRKSNSGENRKIYMLNIESKALKSRIIIKPIYDKWTLLQTYNSFLCYRSEIKSAVLKISVYLQSLPSLYPLEYLTFNNVHARV